MGYRAKQQIFIRGISNGQEAHKEIFNLLVIRQRQTPKTLRFHLTLIRMAKVKNTQELSHAGKDIEQD